MPVFSPPSTKAHLRHSLSHKEAEVAELRAQLSQALTDRDLAKAAAEHTQKQLLRMTEDSQRVRETYLRRLAEQTHSTLALSDTVQSVLNGMKEISIAYKEMLKAVQMVGDTCRALGESFQIQAQAQLGIGTQADAASDASGDEVKQAQALKADLGQLAAIQTFMGQAVETIDEVSSRLSLLSMNGRIEAAHAGAAGRGFAVVAQEMLKLQQESQRIISTQKSQLAEFLPLMATMQDKADTVEAQARGQQSLIREISAGGQSLTTQTRANQDHISGLTTAVEELAASIEQGERTTLVIEAEASKVERIFKEEVFVAQKANTLDQFLFDLTKKAHSLAGAAHTLINEYQRISVLNGASYVWQGEAWLVTSRENLPDHLGDRVPGASRVLVCVGQTDNNPRFTAPLDPEAGILAIVPIDEIGNPQSPLQGLKVLVDRAGLTIDDLKDPRRILNTRGHATMAVNEDLTGPYQRVLEGEIRRGNLVSSFCFGGAFSNGDVLMNLFLSTYKRRHSDAEKFGMLGESLVMSFQGLVDSGAYWR